MLVAASAVIDVDVGAFLVGVRLQRLNLVIFRMTAAVGELLIPLQALNVTLLQESLGEVRYLAAGAMRDSRLGENCALGIAPEALSEDVEWRLGRP